MATSMRGGGSERQVALLAKHLPRDQFEVHLYLTHRTGELLAEVPLDVTLHSPSEGIAGSAANLMNRIPGTILRRQAVEFASIVARERIDVVYDRAFHNTLIAGHPAIKRLSVRRVSTIVSPPRDALPTVEKRFVRAKRRHLANAYHRSDSVIAVSQGAADSAIDYYDLPRQRVTVIRNPVDVSWVRDVAGWTDTPGGRERPVRDGPGPLRIVCVGRMAPEKGQSDLVAAILLLRQSWPKSLPDLSLRFIGDGCDRPSLEQQWRWAVGQDGHCGGHTVEFAGAITPALAEIGRADALILPSRFEGLPNVVLEAFALQVPVVATRSGGTAELQSDSQNPTCFWAAPGDPASLAGALRRLAAEPQQRAIHVRAATQWLQSHHALDAAIEKICEQLLG